MVGLLIGLAAGVGVWSALWEPMNLSLVGARDTKLVPGVRLPAGIELVPLAIGVLVGAVGSVATGRLVTFCALGIVIAVGPALVKGSGSEQQFADTTDAVASWVESLRDLMRGAHGIEGALRASTNSVGPQIRPAVARLNLRRDAGVEVGDALVMLAEEVKNPVMDVAVTSLLASLEHASTELPAVLDELAVRARSMAKDHRLVFRSRKKARTQLRLVGQILIGFLGLSMFALKDTVAPLHEGVGRLAVIATMLWIAAMLLWIANLSTISGTPRVLDPARTRKAKAR